MLKQPTLLLLIVASVGVGSASAQSIQPIPNGVHPNPAAEGDSLRVYFDAGQDCYDDVTAVSVTRSANLVLVRYRVEDRPPDQIPFCGTSPALGLVLEIGSFRRGSYVVQIRGFRYDVALPIQEFRFNVAGTPRQIPVDSLQFSLGLIVSLGLFGGVHLVSGKHARSCRVRAAHRTVAGAKNIP